MGTVSFLLPNGLSADAARELERACMAGGPDNMPWPTDVRVAPDQLTLRRSVDESGYLVVPWEINSVGRLMGTTATLMERALPYHLQVEMARGKVNQLRSQLAEWKTGGLQVPIPLEQQIRDASLAFGRAVTQQPSDQLGDQAQNALTLGYQASEQLVQVYIEQVFHIRQQRQAKLESDLGCRLGLTIPEEGLIGQAKGACNCIGLPLTWKDIESSESSYEWDRSDQVLEWALSHGLRVSAGPLIDFTASQLPDWLWLWERDLSSMARYMCAFVEKAVRRYGDRIRRWQLTAATNCANVLSLGEDELLWLTVRLAEAARQVDPGIELVTGISQPWGEYMALEDRIHSPFIFADTLIRAGLNLAALDIEVVMGASPRGSYCRDLLETSRLLDLYALLGVPLRVTLAYPSSITTDALADPELRVTGGQWRQGFHPEVQADWLSAFAALCLCKPYVQGVLWSHWSDAEAHAFPHCGLIDSKGIAKPALAKMIELREQHVF